MSHAVMSSRCARYKSFNVHSFNVMTHSYVTWRYESSNVQSLNVMTHLYVTWRYESFNVNSFKVINHPTLWLTHMWRDVISLSTFTHSTLLSTHIWRDVINHSTLWLIQCYDSFICDVTLWVMPIRSKTCVPAPQIALTYAWVMAYTNGSRHIWMSHVNYEWVVSDMESCHIWMSHVTYEGVMSQMNESCHI